ncbi:MAG: hypothetical protein M3R57_07990 [Chloroflexota bacterium]|nr:hypothetical protein [Chloroflexota bacterium]
MRTAPSRSLVVLALGLVAALVAGCNVLPGAVPTASGPLVTVSTRGGECPAGACGSQIVIERDGRIHTLQPAPKDLGRVPADALSVLDVAIRTADFALLKSHPFTGECPVNFDGQEVIYEFGAPSGVQRIASCEVEIDANHPLIRAVTNALVVTEG